MNIESLIPYADLVLHYRAYSWHRFASACHVRIFGTQPTLVIVSELPENAGTSVTNAAETIATLVVRQYGLDPARTAWIEHYPNRHPAGMEGDPMFDESFDVVTFEWDGQGAHHPQWQRITPETALETLPCCARAGSARRS